MACSRCQGLMVDEMLFNPSEGVSHTWVPVLRCLNCGNLEDALIRLARGLSGRLGRRTRPGPQRRGVERGDPRTAKEMTRLSVTGAAGMADGDCCDGQE